MMLNKDNVWVGIGIGLALPATIFSIFYLIMEMRHYYVSEEIVKNMILVLFAINAIVMRQFFVTRDQDNIGRGIFMVTFIGVILFVIKYHLF